MQQERQRDLGGKISSSRALSTHFAATEAVDLNLPNRSGFIHLTFGNTGNGKSWNEHLCCLQRDSGLGGSWSLHGHQQLHPCLQKWGVWDEVGASHKTWSHRTWLNPRMTVGRNVPVWHLGSTHLEFGDREYNVQNFETCNLLNCSYKKIYRLPFGIN